MNLQNSYLYDVDVVWSDRRSGQVRAEGRPVLEVAPPPEFAGEVGKWTPEHLLVAAAGSCLMSTFFAIAEISGLTVTSYRSKVLGRLEKVPGEGYRFTALTVVPEIEVAAEDLEKAQKVLAKAEKNCFINNSLRATVQVEPRFLAVAALGT